MKKKYLVKSASVLSCLLMLTACPGKPSDNNNNNRNGVQNTATVGPQGRVTALGSTNIYCDFQNDTINCVNVDPTTGRQCNATRSYDGNNLNDFCAQMTFIQNNTVGCNLSAVTSRVISENCNFNGGANPGNPGQPSNPGNPGSPSVPSVPNIPGAISCGVTMDSGWSGYLYASKGQFQSSSPPMALKIRTKKFLGLFGGSKTVGHVRMFYVPSNAAGAEKLALVIDYKDQNGRNVQMAQEGSAASMMSLNTVINGVAINIDCNNTSAPFAVSDIGTLVCTGPAMQVGADQGRPERIQFSRPLNSIVSGEEMLISKETDAVKGSLNKESGELTLTTNIDSLFGPITESKSSLRREALIEATDHSGVGRVKITCQIR